MGGDGAVDLCVVKEWDSRALVDLYRAGGWWKEWWDPSHLRVLIRSTFLFVVAVDRKTGRTVGMGRAISDGVSDAYIQDLVVLHEFRRQGIGEAILKRLVEVCLSRGITWIALVAEPGTQGFYKGAGFSPMEGHIPMLYRDGKDVC
ncbi:MAG: GNAT family N-acetyltransferase [Methanolinea sp.]|jgi:ribosomal protein S18 acetylase RimI-like enzyme|nr:GNAT family N-acetyltransferase [Methanolinea sp.]